jgi:hypothetical protein
MAHIDAFRGLCRPRVRLRGASMLTQSPLPSMATLETPDELAESRLEAIGYIFHGSVPNADGKRGRAGSNTLHFARCGKLERVAAHETKLWFRTIRLAKQHLDEVIGAGRWKWCKTCEREITQRLLNE